MNMEGQIKVLSHKHIVARRPIFCDCGHSDDHYFVISIALRDKEQKICERCLLWSGKYERKDEFFNIDVMEDEGNIFGFYTATC